MAFKMKNPFKQGIVLGPLGGVITSPRVNLSGNLGLSAEAQDLGKTMSANNEADCEAKGGCWTPSKRETSYFRGEQGLIPDKFQKGVKRPKVATGTCVACQKA